MSFFICLVALLSGCLNLLTWWEVQDLRDQLFEREQEAFRKRVVHLLKPRARRP